MYHIHFVTKQSFKDAIQLMLQSKLFVKSHCSWDHNTFNFGTKKDMQEFADLLDAKGFIFTTSSNF